MTKLMELLARFVTALRAFFGRPLPLLKGPDVAAVSAPPEPPDMRIHGTMPVSLEGLQRFMAIGRVKGIVHNGIQRSVYTDLEGKRWLLDVETRGAPTIMRQSRTSGPNRAERRARAAVARRAH